MSIRYASEASRVTFRTCWEKSFQKKSENVRTGESSVDLHTALRTHLRQKHRISGFGQWVRPTNCQLRRSGAKVEGTASWPQAFTILGKNNLKMRTERSDETAGQGPTATHALSPCSAIQHPLCDVLAPYPVALVVRVDAVSRPVARRGSRPDRRSHSPTEVIQL